MSKVRLIMLSMLAVFAASAVASASAAANNGCEEVGGEKCLWTLEGAALPLGEMRELAPIWNSTFTLRGRAGGSEVEVVSKLIDLGVGTKILGGIPGTGKGTILFKNVEVLKPKECKVNNKEVITNALRSELVELVKAGVPQKVDDVLVEPEVGVNFVTLKFENNPKCALNGVEANLTGSIQAEPSPRKTETLLLTLKAQGKEKWEFRPKGEAAAKKSELKLGGEKATLEGTVDLKMADGSDWGTD